MKLLTTVYLLERYGPRLDMDGIAEVLRMSKGTLHNRLYRGEIALKTYLDGGKRYADAMDLADYLDAMRASATARDEVACSDEAATTTDAR